VVLGDEDFIGREALEERKAHPERQLVGLELEGNEVAGRGDEVYVGRRRVGVVTSGTSSPLLKRSIALCRMSVQYADIDTEVEVGRLDGLQKRIPAKVLRFPLYDPKKKRPRS
jgi:aminomethyltransferase